MDVEIRPKSGRHRRPLVTLALVLGLFALCGLGKVVDRASLHNLRVRPVSLTALILMAVVPFALLVVISRLNVRNVALRYRGGQLVSTEWTGRVVTVEHPYAARTYPIGSTFGYIGELLVITDRSDRSAVVLAPSWWSEEDLDALLHAMHLQLHRESQTGFGTITRRYPDARFPVSVRRPWLFSGGTVLFVIGYLGVMVSLLLRF